MVGESQTVTEPNQACSDREAARKRYEEARVFTNYKQSNRAVMMIKNKRRRVSFVNESHRAQPESHRRYDRCSPNRDLKSRDQVMA